MCRGIVYGLAGSSKSDLTYAIYFIFSLFDGLLQKEKPKKGDLVSTGGGKYQTFLAGKANSAKSESFFASSFLGGGKTKILPWENGKSFPPRISATPAAYQSGRGGGTFKPGKVWQPSAV